MKKISYMLMLALILMSCKSKAKQQESTHPEPIAEPTVADTTRLCDGKKITNTVDLLNYAVGYTTGCQILEQELKGEVTDKQISALMHGLQQGYTNDTKTSIARQIASEILEQKEKGVMEMFAVNAPVMLQGLVNGLYGKEQMIKDQEAQSYFQRTMQKIYMDSTRTVGAAVMGECPMTPQKVALANQTDSLNYIYGQLTGSSMRQNLAITDEEIEPMLVTLKKRLSEKTEDNKMQGIGEQMGMMAKEQWADGFIGVEGLETRIQIIGLGMSDAMKKITYPFVSMDASGKFIESYLKDIQDKKNEVVKKKQLAYLEQNKKREGVQVTESGLQYEVIKMGNGEKPASTDRVKVHYEGSLIDGTVFDSSYKRGEPIVFGLNQVISGWTEGVQLMPVGSKFRLYIPYELGYGERGAGASIPPFATLIFDVELLEINPAEK